MNDLVCILEKKKIMYDSLFPSQLERGGIYDSHFVSVKRYIVWMGFTSPWAPGSENPLHNVYLEK